MGVAELTRALLNTAQPADNSVLYFSSVLLPTAAANSGVDGPRLGKLLDEHGNFYALRGKYVLFDVTLPEEQLQLYRRCDFSVVVAFGSVFTRAEVRKAVLFRKILYLREQAAVDREVIELLCAAF